MALRRQVRKRDKIRVTGPATVTFINGRADVEIDADQSVVIEHEKRKPTKRGLTIPSKKR